MDNQLFVEVIEFTDPVCTWCWGSEPMLRKLETLFEGNIKVSYIMGGLVPDIRDFRDDYNGIGGDLTKSNQNIAAHWIEASDRHGMPVQPKGFNLFTDENPSTYPLNIAYKAAQFQSEELANKYLRRMREAVITEAIQANKYEILIELAGECGLDIPKFIKSLTDKTAENAFMEDLKITANSRVNGFPAFLVKVNNGKELLLKGYQSYDAFRDVILYLTNGKLTEKKVDKTDDQILNFIKKYEKVAFEEIKTTFEYTASELKETLDRLEKELKIINLPVGNGNFVIPYSNSLYCDPSKGIC